MSGQEIKDEREQEPTNASLRSEVGNRWTFDTVFKLIQVLAVIGAAIWGIQEYISFRREHDQLLLAQSRFAVEQQNMLKQQQALALDMAKVQLQSEKMRGELAQVDLSSATSPRLELTNKLEVLGIGKATTGFGKYEALLTVNLENISKEELEVTFVVIEYFIGTFSEFVMEKGSITPLNSPSSTFDLQKSGVVNWSPVGFSASALLASTFPEYKKVLSSAGIDPDKTTPGGRLIGRLKPDENARLRRSYFVHAPTDARVAFIVSLGIDGGGERGTIWRLENINDLKGIAIK